MNEDERYILQTSGRATLPLRHAEFSHHYIVTQSFDDELVGVIKAAGFKAEDVARDVRTMLTQPSKKTPFLNGIKIGGQRIARHDITLCDLFGAKEEKLGVYSSLGIMPLPSGGLHKVAIVSTNTDVTDAYDAPYPSFISVIADGAHSRMIARAHGIKGVMGCNS